jgi:hypothetical protein
MKSLEELLEVERTKYFAQEKAKGFNEAAIRTTWKEKVMVASSIEQKLSIGKSLITESSRRVERKNGSGSPVVESASEQRVAAYAKKLRCSLKEAAAFLGVEFTPEEFRGKEKQYRKLRQFGFSESDTKKIIENGW